LHGAVVTEQVNIAQHVDLLIGVVPVINLEWIQKLQRDSEGGRLTVTLVGDSGGGTAVRARLGNRPARQALGRVGAPAVLAMPGVPSGWWTADAELDPDELRLDDRRTGVVRVAPVARVDWDSSSRYVAATEVDELATIDGEIDGLPDSGVIEWTQRRVQPEVCSAKRRGALGSPAENRVAAGNPAPAAVPIHQAVLGLEHLALPGALHLA
jgi:hypothetical protein